MDATFHAGLPRTTLFPALAALVFVTAAAAAPGSGARPVLVPGALHTFPDAPSAVQGEHDSAAIGFSNVVQDATPLRAYAYGIATLARSSASVHEDHEFTLADSHVPGAQPGRTLDAQIAGSVRVRGFLFTMGGASADAGVELQLFDITDTAEEPKLVWSASIKEYHSNSLANITLGAEANVEVQGGFPFVGASGGGGIGVEFGIQPDLQILRDQAAFGHALALKRGHTYRLRLELGMATHNRVFAGTSIASFYSSAMGGPVVPNAFNPDAGQARGTENSWMSLLTHPSPGKAPVFGGTVRNFGLPKSVADITCTSILGVSKNIWEQDLGVFNQLSSDEASNMQRSDRFLAQVFSTPLGGAITPARLVDSDFMRTANDTETESVDLPGVELSGLTLSLGDDLGELHQSTANRTLEQNLKAGTVLASAILPRSAGGELEDVLALVDRYIQEFTTLGLPLNNAPFFQSLAHTEYTSGNYRVAYGRARTAYLLLTREP